MYNGGRRRVFPLTQVCSTGIYWIFVFCGHSTKFRDIKKNPWALIRGIDHLECEVSLSPARGAKRACGKISLLVSSWPGFQVKRNTTQKKWAKTDQVKEPCWRVELYRCRRLLSKRIDLGHMEKWCVLLPRMSERFTGVGGWEEICYYPQGGRAAPHRQVFVER